MSELKFGDKIDKKQPKSKQVTYNVSENAKSYGALDSSDRKCIHDLFIILRHTHKRYDAIMQVAVSQNVTPEAISQILREDYNHCL